MLKGRIIACFALIIISSEVLAQRTDTVRRPISFFLSTGFVSGNDYANDLRSALTYNGYSVGGYLAWISLDLGLDISVSKNFVVSPHINTLYDPVNYSSVDGLPGTESANLLFLPGVTVKYYFFNEKSSSIFISCGVSPSITGSDTDNLDYKPNGIEKEVFIGYEHASGFIYKRNKTVRAGAFSIKLGYMSIPVSVLNNQNGAFDDHNYGGYAFSLGWSY
jgi:hypothetical protein